MPKTTDVPVELREFNRIFEGIARQHDYSPVFSDFLDLLIKQFSFDDPTELNERIQKQYTQDERYAFGTLIQETIKVLHEKIVDDTDWYDLFGTYYEVLASNSKREGFGQFFSPSSAVNVLTDIIAGENFSGKGKLISDPCCGSGRMLLSFHAKHPGNFLVAQDIDLVCCKMTIANMALHGCSGEVVWGNSLNPEDFRQGWRLTPYVMGIPQVYKIDKSESLTWQMWENQRKQAARKEIEKQPVKTEFPKQPVQLELNFV